MRLLSILLLLAVLPTVELTEQVVHLVEHALEVEAADHTAHHDPGDEHGCTGLMHLCSCHHTQVNVAPTITATSSVETRASIATRVPPTLIDLNSLEPPHRPPIG
ncbi:MAG: hypothetical protein JWP01_2832 [Myxococcales bacterium]|nr:hypothetical protein [Myxococcales bacterium]